MGFSCYIRQASKPEKAAITRGKNIFKNLSNSGNSIVIGF